MENASRDLRPISASAMSDETRAIDEQLRKNEGADDHSQRQSVKVPIDNRGNGPSSGVVLTYSVTGLVCGILGLVFGFVAYENSNHVFEAASSAARAQAKAETATARANVSELYAKQVYTELNRLGYPVKTPAEEHAPQPSDNVSEVPGK